jgi:hypothetical protein
VSVGTAALSWVFEAMSRIDATSRADEMVSDADARDNGIIEVRGGNSVAEVRRGRRIA